MNGREKLSAAVMVLGLFALWSALANNHPISAAVSVVFVVQYPAWQFYKSYREAATPTTAEATETD